LLILSQRILHDGAARPVRPAAHFRSGSGRFAA
jgi:hypothetical protein